jgi:very-short-patch-repair endonuclease
MKFARENKNIILDMHDNGSSSYEIAEELGTYSTKILRALKFLGAETRSYSEAQKLAIKKGRSKSPVEKGSKLSEAHKIASSEGRSKAWSEISDEERSRISAMKKAQWAAMTDEQKSNLRSLAADAVREASREGSKTEKFLRKSLTEAGWSVKFHEKTLIPAEKLEVDLYIAELKLAIEIDGPAHFLPIWGEENLAKHQKADDKKTGLLLNEGYIVLRVKQLTKSLSNKKERDVLKAILSKIDFISNNELSDSEKFIEIEV